MIQMKNDDDESEFFDVVHSNDKDGGGTADPPAKKQMGKVAEAAMAAVRADNNATATIGDAKKIVREMNKENLHCHSVLMNELVTLSTQMEPISGLPLGHDDNLCRIASHEGNSKECFVARRGNQSEIGTSYRGDTAQET